MNYGRQNSTWTKVQSTFLCPFFPKDLTHQPSSVLLASPRRKPYPCGMKDFRWSLGLCVLALGASAGESSAQKFRNFQPASVVLGQSSFTSNGTDPAGPFTMDFPVGIAVSPTTGKVFVAELNRNRILRFSSAAAMSSGASAERVFGQNNFTAVSPNKGGATGQSTLNFPRRIFVDASDRLWVPDQLNHRILRFDNASGIATDGANASAVVGQANFTANGFETAQNRLRNPLGVWLDASANLWVADLGNHRVLRFPPPYSAANAVFGQPNYTTAVLGTGPGVMNDPLSVSGDASGNLWVADGSNHRILRFANAAAAPEFGALPAAVLGQANFSGGSPGGGATGFDFPSGLVAEPGGRLWVGDNNNTRILWFDNAAALPSGAPASGVIGQESFSSVPRPVSARSVSSVSSLAFDLEGRLWVADTSHNRALRFDRQPDGPPKVSILGPKRLTQKKSNRKMRGTAVDDGPIVRVEVRVGRGAFVKASGNEQWRFLARRLKQGTNRIFAQSIDDSGNRSALARVIVRRKS